MASTSQSATPHARAEELIDRLQRAQQAMYAGGDSASLRELLTSDIEWHVPGSNPIAGDYLGIEAVLAYFHRRRDLAGRTFTLHREQVLVGPGPFVAAVTRGEATVGGRAAQWWTVGLYKLRGELISHCWLLPFDQAAFDAVWTPDEP